MAETNEPPVEALRRELAEELGLHIPASDMTLLCLDWVSPHGPWDDSLMFIFDAGTLDAEQIAGLSLADAELAAYEFVRRNRHNSDSGRTYGYASALP